MNIRTVTPTDAPQLLHIYAPYVENTTVTFEYEVPSVEEFADRIRHTLEKYPYLAAEEDNIILGYAYASAFKDRAAYAWSVETSIYVREDLNHKGIGTALYQALEQVLARQNICNLCACIAYPNPASISFHERFGYRTVAHFHASGFKQDTWSDMVWMEKELCPHTVPPGPFIPFPGLSHE
ncbi:MAG: GNAT family N-acetyltransferase [Muribaculaceae bacterium]|nr:GNAT family N-acetyltransferase [Muribaculaceae bacterium]